MELVEGILHGDRRALSRAITLLERETPEGLAVLKAVYSRTGRGAVVGVTGPPGAGKSTIVDRLTAIARAKGLTVGIIAVDPTSPFTGGAVLGDRVRMQQHYLDEGVFIRSMATRGSHGGLPRVATRVASLMDAFGFDLILVETVGVGQTELDIMELADTVVVVLVPESGDAVQAMKAGLMEIANIFAVNKSDREGASHLVTELLAMLELSEKRPWWSVPVISTQAHLNIGMDELYQAIQSHRAALQEASRLEGERRHRRRREFYQTLEGTVFARLVQMIEGNGRLNSYLEQVESGALDPYSAAQEVMETLSLPSADI